MEDHMATGPHTNQNKGSTSRHNEETEEIETLWTGNEVRAAIKGKGKPTMKLKEPGDTKWAKETKNWNTERKPKKMRSPCYEERDMEVWEQRDQINNKKCGDILDPGQSYHEATTNRQNTGIRKLIKNWRLNKLYLLYSECSCIKRSNPT